MLLSCFNKEGFVAMPVDRNRLLYSESLSSIARGVSHVIYQVKKIVMLMYLGRRSFAVHRDTRRAWNAFRDATM